MEDPITDGTWLEQLDGPRIRLEGNCSLGRTRGSTVLIASENASRHHATIHMQDAGEFWLIDLGSINGTLLNDRRVARPVQLKDGDRIAIADTTFTFRQSDEVGDASLRETLPTIPQMRSEHRWLMLADLEGFTPLSQRLPAEELATLVGTWVRCGRELVEGNGGAMNKYLGDGYLACWSSRQEAPAEVAAAVRGFRELWEKGEPRFRIIVHHGQVSIGGTAAASFGEESLMGPELNFIFRVEKIAAQAGAAFCFTAAAYTALAGLLPFQVIAGEHELKGFPGRYTFYRL